jgi:hypothetical protein
MLKADEIRIDRTIPGGRRLPASRAAMKREAYAAARTISPRIHAYFARHREEALLRGEEDLAPLPDVETIEAVIDTAFWSSLRREEGYIPRISLAILSRQDARQSMLFERPLPLQAGALTRVAPAVERPGIHLGVWRDEGELCVWGATRVIPVLCLVLEVLAPGLLVIKHHRGEESQKFVNVAVLEGDQIKLVEERPGNRLGPPPLVRSLLRFDEPETGAQSLNTTLQLAVSMREHGRGGLLLVVPTGAESWRESIVHPMSYAVSPAFGVLACLNQKSPDFEDRRVWQDAMDSAIRSIAGLTAVDGAVVINDRFDVLGFGAKVGRRHGWERVEEVVLSEPIIGAVPAVVHPEQLGGTRHLAAAQFVHDQRDAVALAASQDGRFTVFEWSDDDSRVHAYRVESVLL